MGREGVLKVIRFILVLQTPRQAHDTGIFWAGKIASAKEKMYELFLKSTRRQAWNVCCENDQKI